MHLPKIFYRGNFYFANAVLFAKENSSIAITELTNRLRVEIGGKLFTEYYFKDVLNPFCYPLIGPGEVPESRIATV